jgi:hypothetical protein
MRGFSAGLRIVEVKRRGSHHDQRARCRFLSLSGRHLRSNVRRTELYCQAMRRASLHHSQCFEKGLEMTLNRYLSLAAGVTLPLLAAKSAFGVLGYGYSGLGSAPGVGVRCQKTLVREVSLRGPKVHDGAGGVAYELGPIALRGEAGWRAVRLGAGYSF